MFALYNVLVGKIILLEERKRESCWKTARAIRLLFDNNRDSRSWSIRDWKNWKKVWFLYGAPRLVNSTTAIESETARPKWYCSEIIVSSKAPRRIPIPWCHGGSRDPSTRSSFFSHPFSIRPWNERSLLTDPIPATRTITFAIPRFLGTETKRSCREIRSEILSSCWYLLIARIDLPC